MAGLEVGAEDSAPPPPPPLVSFVGGEPPSTVCGRTTPAASCDCVQAGAGRGGVVEVVEAVGVEVGVEAAVEVAVAVQV